MTAKRLDEAFLANLLAILKRVDAHERELRDAFRDSMAEIQQQLTAAYVKYGRDNTIPYAEAAKYGRLTALERSIIDELKRLGDTEAKALDKVLTGVYRESYYRGAWTLDALAGMQVNFAQLPTEAIREILRFPWSGARYSDRLYQDTRLLAQRVKETITRGMIQGDSMQQIAAELQGRYDAGHGNALRIVRTEAIHFSNTGSMAAYREAGIGWVEWLATLDARTCSRCAAMDRKRFPIEEAPTPPLHPNCRCTLIPVIDGMVDGSRIARDADGTYYVDGDTTYQQWYDEHVAPGVLPRKVPAPGAVLSESLMVDRELGIWIPRNTEVRDVYVIAGKGVSVTLRNAESLAREYGGAPAEWQKLVGRVLSDRYEFDVHWEQNPAIGAVRHKVKSFRERRPNP